MLKVINRHSLIAMLLSVLVLLAMTPGYSFAASTAAMVGENQYATLQAAVDAVANGTDKGSVILVANVKESVVIPSGSYVVIDLNGHEIINVDGGHTIENNGSLKLKSTNGKAVIDNITHAKACIMNNIGGVATVFGEIDMIRSKVSEPVGNGKTRSWYNVCNRGTMTLNEGVYIKNNATYHTAVTTGHLEADHYFPEVPECKLTINGATIEGGANCIKVDSAGILEMNGGTLLNDTKPAIINWNVATINDVVVNAFQGVIIAKHTWTGSDTPSEPTEKGITIINGGTFNCSNAIFNKSGSSENEAGAEVTINGGTFKGPIPPKSYLDKSTITVYGGNFNRDVTAAVVFNDDRALVQGEDGYFHVKTVDERDADASEAVRAMINALPPLVDLTLDNKAAVQQAKDAFDALTDVQKALVSNAEKEKLEKSVEKIGDLDALKNAKEEANDELDSLLASKNESNYYSDDWSNLTRAIQDGKTEIEMAASIGEVGDIKIATINAVAEIKTISEKESEAIAAAKQEAKDVLDNLLAGKIEANYDSDDWSDLTRAIQDGKTEIDMAASIGEVGDIKIDTINAVAAIKTKAEKAAATLDEAKTAAIEELEGLLASKKESDYDSEDWTELTKAIEDGMDSINEAATIDEVDDAKNAAINAVAEIKTKAEKISENLAAAKEAAKDVLDNLLLGKIESNYDSEDWTELTNAILDGKTAIEDAATINEVDQAKHDAEDAVAAIKTKAEKERDAAEIVRAKINALPRIAELALDDKAAVQQAKDAFDALTNAQKALVSNAEKEKLDTAVDKIKRLEDEKAAEEKAQKELSQKGEDGTEVGPGASAACADRAIITGSLDKDPAGSKFAPLKLKSTKQGKNNIVVKWAKVSGAKKYVLYGNACGTKYKMKKLTSVAKNSFNVKKITKKLKKKTYHKFIVVALDKNNNVISTSKVIHVATKGSKKKANPTNVTVTKKVVNKAKKMKVGKTLALKAKVGKKKNTKVKTHVKIRYESSNTKIATVSNAGKVKAKAKGKCKIYAYAQNGIVKNINITVK